MSQIIDYSEEVMEHFTNPRNVGEIENASGVGTVLMSMTTRSSVTASSRHLAAVPLLQQAVWQRR